jgi:fucose permease
MRLSRRRSILAVCCLIFLSFGFAMTVIGPLVPELAARTHSSLSAAGGVFAASFLGGLISELIAGPISDRLGQARVLLVGLVIYVVGLAGLTLSRNLALTLAVMLFAGFGSGILIVCTNVLIAQTFARNSVPALNMVNVAWGVGAVLGPAAAGWALATWETGFPAVWVGIGCLACTTPFVYRVMRHTQPPAEAPAPTARHEETGAIYRSPLLWVGSCMFMAYVGTESAIGGWATTYIDHTTALGLTTGALVTSGFWLALTLGRLAGTLWGGRVTPHTVVRLCLAGAALGAPLLALSIGHATISIAAVLLLGLSFGALWPTSFAILIGAFRHTPGTAGSIATAMGSLGGMWLPWLGGALLEQRGASAYTLLVIAGVLGIAALYAALRSLLTRRMPLEGEATA